MDALPDMASLRLDSQARLDNLPIGVLRAIFQHLNTAQSLGRLARTSKKLSQIVENHGWNVFIRNHFGHLDLPTGTWKALAKTLTWQTRAWDRRALLLSSLVSPKKLAPGNRGRRGRGGRSGNDGGRPTQTFPPSVIVDATSHITGKTEEELLAWGIGEDIVLRWRELRYSAPKKEKWTKLPGEQAGFKAGRDDVSAVSLLQDPESEKTHMMLVGRASGYIQLLSTHRKDMGRTIAWLEPELNEKGSPSESAGIQHMDADMLSRSVVVARKDSILFCPLPEQWPDPAVLPSDENGHPAPLSIQPTEVLDVKDLDGCLDFQRIRQVRHMYDGNIALALSGSKEPMRYLTRTPSGTVITNAAKMEASARAPALYTSNHGNLHTSRCVLPLDSTSLPGGSRYTMLSSYDDGTIRLHDLRTPSAIDTIYQDHFELTTPIGPLLADGNQRFLAGSARTSVLKIFDYRWNKSYYYTDAVPCSKTRLPPTPRPLTWIFPPHNPLREHCDFMAGKYCTRHTFARTDFHRPNCNVYLPNIYQDVSPVYTLARASPMSPSVYAGLSGELVTMSLRDQVAAEKETLFMQKREKKLTAGYTYHESLTSLVETGDGIALDDVTKSQRVPAVRKHGRDPAQVAAQEFGRLDEWLM